MATSQIDKQIQDRINSFLGELTGLVRKAALESVAEALGGEIAAAPTRRGPGRPRKTTASSEAGAKKTATRRKGKRIRRTAADIEATKADILKHLSANPGSGMESISAALKMATKDVRGPMLKLAAAKKVRMTGQKRGAKYFVKGR